MKSAAKKAADARYDAKTYEQIKIISRKSDRLRGLVALAASRAGVSSGEYIRSAIRFKLEQDRIALCDLGQDMTTDDG